MECATPLNSAQKLGTGPRLLTRLIHGWGRLTRGVTLGVKAAAINDEGNILLVRHTYVPGWHLPGGGVEIGETAEQAVGRELTEEAAIRLDGRPRLHGLFLNLNLGRRDHVAVYVVDRFTQGAVPAPNREIAEIGFFPPGSLPESLTGPTRRRLSEIIEGAPPAAHW
ncbi:NUDIX domain-containing protein [Ancylobacter radicis]|uniref:NUDIX domain-containing protein n=1 Tax=Ancylobacter radicis TaxID=2836179 RepID=A0ABS5RA37_9HYPH|nr:NUDIX domain-containing protein [Ancylobacter radicis]MBS9478533.1 NUDIX domain-containing protein [Ancylobacter radicis]